MSDYLTRADADTLPGLVAWKSATAAAKTAALAQAQLEVDAGMRYQGRQYDADQARQFPRVPYEGKVWDWDSANNVAIVPEAVELAVLHQADSILAGERQERLDKQHDGVVYDQSGGLAESYKTSDRPGLGTGLCRQAWVQLQPYVLRTGQMR